MYPRGVLVRSKSRNGGTFSCRRLRGTFITLQTYSPPTKQMKVASVSYIGPQSALATLRELVSRGELSLNNLECAGSEVGFYDIFKLEGRRVRG